MGKQEHTLALGTSPAAYNLRLSIDKKMARACSASEYKGSKRPRAKGLKNHKETKGLRFRLAETERELAARTPIVRRPRPSAAQPQTTDAAFELEDVRVAAGAGDLLHTDIKPFS